MSKKINFVKAVYGKEAFDNNSNIRYLGEMFVGWVINEYPSLSDLEAKFSDEEILELHRQTISK